MSAEEKVTQLRGAVSAAQQRHARAVTGLTAAEARAAAAREDLQAGFGVSTVAQAEEKLAQLERDLEARAAEVRRQLALAGGGQ
jgi:hypothetical protein